MINDLKLVTKNNKEQTTVKVGDIEIGKDFFVIAGPCSVENEEQILSTAIAVKQAGANMLRGGCYKLRSSPYTFQGLGEQGLIFLKNAGDKVGLPVVTEVIDTREVELVSKYSDILQIGARNMQNFALLSEVGKTNKPVLLKRGIYATIDEWLHSAEYILKEGNPNVILCERGIRTVENYTRNTLDVSSIVALKSITHLPIIADPSHATGRAELVGAVSLSAIMAGCDGLEIEVHPSPSEALSDSNQQLDFVQFASAMERIKATVNFRDSISRR